MAEQYLKNCLRKVGEQVEADMERGGTANLATQTISAETKKGDIEKPKTEKKEGDIQNRGNDREVQNPDENFPGEE